MSSSHFCSRHKNEERTPSFMQSARLGKATLRGHHLPPRCFCGEKLLFGLNHFLAKEYQTSKWLGRVWCSELTKQKLSSKYLTPDNRNLIFGVAICLTFLTFIFTEALSTANYWSSQVHLTIRAEKVFHHIQQKTNFVSQQSQLQIFHLFSWLSFTK